MRTLTLGRKSPGKSCRKFALCDIGVDYVGFYDVLVFYVTANFIKEMLVILTFWTKRSWNGKLVNVVF